ncbi:MAG: hypothetical protein HYY96_13245 [Candidatus Tectomicrobia bacterium]|nr:hypothetical protein [Candidatus Tectomicrobia bacterium]
MAGALPETEFLAALRAAGFAEVVLFGKQPSLRGAITLWAEFSARRAE